MAFLLKCPNCGGRSVYEFRFGGEILTRPEQEDPFGNWVRYAYLRKNVAGNQREWWYHKFGCRKWFFALRDTITNQVHETWWPESITG